MASKVFVGNLEFDTRRDALQELFEQAGPVRDVILPTDRATGRPRGFAFVEFESEEDAERAIEKFDGFELGGRSLRVNAATERPPQRPGGPSQGFGPPPRFGRGKPKGSRRNLRARKRSL